MSILTALLHSDSPALIRHAQLEPVAGVGTPVAPAIYADRENRVNQNAPVPVADDNGFLLGQPVSTAPSVVISSVAAEAGRAESALWHDPRIQHLLPAVTIGAPKEANSAKAIESALKAKKFAQFDSASRRQELAAILHDIHLSTWELPHRHIDGWLRYANTSDGTSLWSQPDSDAYKNVTSADPATIARVSLNSLLWGYWLAAGATSTHRRARSISTQIIGFGASPAPVHATKVSPLPASAHTEVADQGGQLVMQSGKGKKKPSELGIGSVITSDPVLHYTCTSIASLTSISLTDLRALTHFGVDDTLGLALLGIAILSTEAAGDHLHLRSECDLIENEAPVWGTRVRGSRSANRVDLDRSTVFEETVDFLKQAIHNGALAGSAEYGVDRLELELSLTQAQVVCEAQLETLAKGYTE